MAFEGVAALVAAIGSETAVTAAMVLTAAAEVGTALTVVGAVTGNEDLMKIGGVLGLVGGIGGLINGAIDGAAGAAAGGLEGAADSAFDAAGNSITDSLATPGMDALESSMTPAEMMSGSSGTFGDTAAQQLAAGPNTGIVQSAATPTTDALAQPTTSSTSGGVPASSQASLSNVETTTSRMAGATDVKSPYDALSQSDMDVGAGMKTMGPKGPLPASATPVKSDSWWASLGDNSKAAVIKTGAGLLQGAAQGANQKEQNDIARTRINQTSYGSQVPVGIVRKAAAA